ncbi:hypothetical protein GCM10009113_11610 [Marinobacter szutsaonensis]
MIARKTKADVHPISARHAVRYTTPKGMIPEVRQPDFDLADDVPEDWWDNDPAKTLLLATLSAVVVP